MKSKKAGILGASHFILTFMLIITTSLFYSVFLYEVGGDNVVDPLTNQTLIAGNLSIQMFNNLPGFTWVVSCIKI